jgi:acyl carrier protein
MKRLQEIIAAALSCDIGDLPPSSTPFRDYKEWDSLRHVSLVIGLESTFQVELSADEIKAMVTAADVLRLLKDRGVHE